MKFLIGIMLIPLSAAMSGSLMGAFSRWNFLEQYQFLLAAGFMTYLVLHVAFYRPIFAYVVAHEFTHAVWAWILGRDVGEIKVKAEGGHVMVGGPNAFIALVPYFFPFYAFITLVVMYIAVPGAQPYLMFLLGAALSFHVVLTISMLTRPQSDLEGVGRVFGLLVVYAVNVLVMACLVMALFPTLLTPRVFAESTWKILQEWATGLIDLI